MPAGITAVICRTTLHANDKTNFILTWSTKFNIKQKKVHCLGSDSRRIFRAAYE